MNATRPLIVSWTRSGLSAVARAASSQRVGSCAAKPASASQPVRSRNLRRVSSSTSRLYARGVAYTVLRLDELEWSTPSAGDQTRGIARLSDALTHMRANIWRMPAGSRGRRHFELVQEEVFVDRKSTRLNSSHVKISYAVFCLK